MADEDGPGVAETVYGYVFREGGGFQKFGHCFEYGYEGRSGG